jgi:hypothetical protein
MKSNQIIMIASGVAAGIIAWIVARKRSMPDKKVEYPHFRKNRHLTPAFANFKKHS